MHSTTSECFGSLLIPFQADSSMRTLVGVGYFSYARSDLRGGGRVYGSIDEKVEGNW